MRPFFAQELQQSLHGKTPCEAIAEGMERAIEAGHYFYGSQNIAEALAAFHQEVAELDQAFTEQHSKEAIRNELGDVLQTLINLTRMQQIDFAEVQRHMAQRWLNRKAEQEKLVQAQGYQWHNLPVEVRDATWKEAKKRLKQQEYQK